MKKSYLFPTYFKKIGWIVTLPVMLYMLIAKIFDLALDFTVYMPAIYAEKDLSSFFGNNPKENAFFTIAKTSFASTLLPVLIVIGLSFIAFSRHKNEDEYISKIREQSLVWSMIVGYLIFILLTLFLYGTVYIAVIMYDIYLFLILFIFKFNFELYRLKKSLRNEE